MSEGRESSDKLKGFDDYAFSLGDELRGERATLGKSLLDVQKDLRIKAAYIAAIENCDPTVFPNQGFIAGYVRSYARYLKLEPDEMFDRFCTESGFEGVNAGMLPSENIRQKKKSLQPLKGAEVAPRFPSYGAQQTDSILNLISPSGIASAVVLTVLICGLGIGGWTLLNDIQRVEFAPVDQTPSATASSPELSIASAETELTANTPVLSQAKTNDEADVLGRLYRPQELAVPKLQPRDGPIASIDPDTVGVLKPEPLPTIIPTVSETVQSASASIPTEPIVSIEAATPEIQLYATRAAWVRVHYTDGSILFEKILEAGEYYTLPPDAEPPLLRAGNSGSVYLLVDNVPFGPVGSGTSVAKQITLSELDIRESFAVAQGLDLAPEVESTLSTAGNQ